MSKIAGTPIHVQQKVCRRGLLSRLGENVMILDVVCRIIAVGAVPGAPSGVTVGQENRLLELEIGADDNG